MVHRVCLLICLALMLALAGCEPLPEGDGPKEPGKAKPGTYKIEKGPFKVEVACKGVFEAEQMTEVALSPEAWTPDTGGKLTIVTAVEHGTPVKKGDVLLTFDTERLDQLIHDLEADKNLAELAIKQAEEELPVLERSTPADLTAAERARKLADEDLKRFTDEERAVSEKIAHYDVKRSQQYLDYAKEELKQLEKMYRAKDLTEETEEIILRRQRNAVEAAEFFLKVAEIDRDLTLKVALPRREQTLKEGATKTALALEKAQATLPLALDQKRLGLVKLKYERQKTADRLARLKRDREALTVKAPADGIAYHGKCVRGQWAAAAVSGKLQRGGMIMPDEVLLTVVKPRPLCVRAIVEEKDLANVKPGAKAKVAPASDPDKKLTAVVEKVTAVPVAPGSFEARLGLRSGTDAEALAAGMACTVKIVPYAKEDAVAVPSAAVFADELDEDKHFVYLPSKTGKPEKRTVTVGKTAGGKTEIVDGLKEGDEILLEKPGPAGKQADAPSKDAEPKKGES